MTARHAWIDASAGVAGDMLLGALVDAGASVEAVQRAVDVVVPGSVRLIGSPVTRGGLRALKVDVSVLDEDPPHRSWRSIRGLLAALPDGVRERALAVFSLLADVEARVHQIAVEEVHFHEVGSLDSIADVVGVCAALTELGVTSVSAGEVALGSGRVRTAHGELPVPAPAVAELARGWQVRAGGRGELATPTGMAVIRALSTTCEDLPPMTVDVVGVGAGGRDFPDRPNVTRVLLGTPTGPSTRRAQASAPAAPTQPPSQPDPANQPAGPTRPPPQPDQANQPAGPTRPPPQPDQATPAQPPAWSDEASQPSTRWGEARRPGTPAQPVETNHPAAHAKTPTPPEAASQPATSGGPSARLEEAVLLEANVDDLDPRLWPGVLTGLMDSGASDAWLAPIIMKKGRPAHTLSVLCPPERVAVLRARIFRDTSTLGVRESPRRKTVLDRGFHPVELDGGRVTIKVGRADGIIVQVMPEFEDVAGLARQTGRAERVVLQEALNAAAAAGLIVGHILE